VWKQEIASITYRFQLRAVPTLARVLLFTAYAVKCRAIFSTSLSLIRSSVIISWYLPTFVLPISNTRPISCRSCNSVEALSSRLSERINSRTVVIRFGSSSGFRLALSLNRLSAGDMVREGRRRSWEAMRLLADVWSRDLGVGNDTVRLCSLPKKSRPGVETVGILGTFLAYSDG